MSKSYSVSSPHRLSSSQASHSHILTKTTSKPNKKSIICPICTDVINDASGKKPGHESIFCDGYCQEWLHRQCAGLSKAVFMTVSSSNEPFFCTRCLIQQQLREIADLKASVVALSEEVSCIKNDISILSNSPGNVSTVNPNIQHSDVTNKDTSGSQATHLT